jgi:hypothetical protein
MPRALSAESSKSEPIPLVYSEPEFIQRKAGLRGMLQTAARKADIDLAEGLPDAVDRELGHDEVPSVPGGRLLHRTGGDAADELLGEDEVEDEDR